MAVLKGNRQYSWHGMEYIVVCVVDRRFGGHEEGGWWYDRHHYLYHEPVNFDDSLWNFDRVEKRQEQLYEKFKRYDYGQPRGNVNGSPDLEVYISSRPYGESRMPTPYYS